MQYPDDLVRKQVAPDQQFIQDEEFNIPEAPGGIPPPGYGYSMGMRPNPNQVRNTQQVKQQPQQVQNTTQNVPGGFSTYPIFKDIPCRPAPSSNGDSKEAEYEKFINWVVNAHIGKTWTLIDFILLDGRKVQGSIMNLVNLSYKITPKPSEMGIEIVLNDKLYKGFICIPLLNIQLEKVTIANSQYQW